MPDYTAEDCRNAMVDAALDRASRIQRDYDPGQEATPDRIEQMVRDADAAWDLGDDGEYTDESELEQCGYLVGASLNEIGDYLADDQCADARPAPGIVPECIGSTARLYYVERWEAADLPQPSHPPPEEIERGDIVVVGDDQGDFGDHITIATSSVDEPGHFTTVEANGQNVLLADGTRGEGLGTNRRHIEEVAIVHRLRGAHFVGDAVEV